MLGVVGGATCNLIIYLNTHVFSIPTFTNSNSNFTVSTLYNSSHNLVSTFTEFQIWPHFLFSLLFLSAPLALPKMSWEIWRKANFKFVISSKSFKKNRKALNSLQKKIRFWLTSIIIHEKNNEIPIQGVLDAQQKCDSES